MWWLWWDFWIWINFPVVRHCHLPKVFFRKSCWRRSVSPLPIHQHLRVSSWRVDLGDLWVCQRWIVFLVAARSERVKHRSSQLRYAMELMSKRLRYEMQKENSKNPQRCMDVLMQVVSPHTIVLGSWSRIEDSGLVFVITRNGSSKFVVFEKNYCNMYGRWNLFQGWNFLQTSSGQQKCICFRNHKPSRWGVGAWSLGGFMAYARAPDFALKIGPWLGAPGWWVLTDIFGAQCFVGKMWI